MSARLAAAAVAVGLALTGCTPATPERPAYTYTYAPDYASCSPVSATSKVCAFVRIAYRSTKGGEAIYECLEATMPAVAGLPRADAETVLRRDVASTCQGINFVSVAVLEDPRLVDREVYTR